MSPTSAAARAARRALCTSRPIARLATGLAASVCAAGLLASAAFAAAPTGAAAAPRAQPLPALQDTKPKRPDQVAVRSRRGDSVTQVPGEVVENSLENVVVKTADGEEKFDSGLVLRVGFGEVPTSYRDGMLYLDRREFALAAGSFRQAAADGEAREIVRASARLRAAEALLALGAQEPAHFAEAAEEAQRFLDDFATNRELPEATKALARALHLAGKPVEAAAAYRQLYDKLSAGEAPTGYDHVECFRAGLAAAHCLLAGQDTLGARELFSSLGSTLGPIVAGLEDSAEKRALQEVLDEATLGEGFAELSAGNARPALTFFQNQESALSPTSSDALRYGVLLGLGESLLAEGQAREAQLALSQVSALDHTSRDRVARALLRQAEAGVRLSDPRESIRPLLAAVDQSYGDTPWAAAARQMLQALN